MAPWAAAREESKDSTWGRKGQKLSGDAGKEQKTLEQQTSNTSQPPMETFPWGGYFLQNQMFHMYFILNSCFLY